MHDHFPCAADVDPLVTSAFGGDPLRCKFTANIIRHTKNSVLSLIRLSARTSELPAVTMANAVLTRCQAPVSMQQRSPAAARPQAASATAPVLPVRRSDGS